MRRLFVPAFLIACALLHSQGLSVAVAPFANLSGQKAQDYLGFQVAEFVAGGLAGYPGVKVVERGAIDRIIQEQELQLSGLTSEKGAVQVGALANAAQMVVGSFTVDAKGVLSLTGRLVDVASGAVLGSATVAGPTLPSPAALYRDFVFKLLASAKGYAVTVAVEGRLATLSEEDSGVSADYARALEASFRKNDGDARKYLEKVVQGERLALSSYVDASARYNAVVSRLEGESLYATLVKAQVSSNAELMAQVGPLSVYRNTLKSLYLKVDALLVPGAAEAVADKKESVALSSTGAVVTLPAVRLRLKDDARTAIAGVFAGQSLVSLGPKGLVAAQKPPTGSLISRPALEGLFDLSFQAELGYDVVFRDKAGAELWRLCSKPVAFLRLAPDGAAYEAAAPASFSVPVVRDGWALRPDGTVEIQSRALKALAGIAVEPNAGSLKKTSYFASAGDLRWKSLVLHAYRKKYAKLAADGDPCPAIKDLVLADSFFQTRDESLGRVPVLPDDDKRAAFADLTAVVYFGDETTTTVQASWTRNGKDAGVSPGFAGALNSRSVLYFPEPQNRTGSPAASVQATVKVGALSSRGVSVSPVSGRGWTRANVYGDLMAAGASGVFVAGSGISSLDAADGKTKWNVQCRILSFNLVGQSLFAASRRLDAGTGKEVWAASDNAVSCYVLDGSQLYTASRNNVSAQDAETGRDLWRANRGAAKCVLDTGRLFCVDGNGPYALDAATGAELWKAAGSGADLALSGGVLFTAGRNCAAYNPATGAQLWRATQEGRALLVDGGRVYVSDGGRVCALDAATGRILWKDARGGPSLVLDGTRLYATAQGQLTVAIDAATGAELWTAPWYRGIALYGNILYAAGDSCAALDLSLINRD